MLLKMNNKNNYLQIAPKLLLPKMKSSARLNDEQPKNITVFPSRFCCEKNTFEQFLFLEKITLLEKKKHLITGAHWRLAISLGRLSLLYSFPVRNYLFLVENRQLSKEHFLSAVLQSYLMLTKSPFPLLSATSIFFPSYFIKKKRNRKVARSYSSRLVTMILHKTASFIRLFRLNGFFHMLTFLICLTCRLLVSFVVGAVHSCLLCGAQRPHEIFFARQSVKF